MQKSDISLAVVLPVYNEEGAIEKVVRDWLHALDGLDIAFEIHAYNDGSADGTAKILGELARADARVCVHNKENSGHGPTILGGYLENCDKEWIFQVDSDDEMKPDRFAELWSRRAGYDILVGERDRQGQPWPRRVISVVSRATVRLVFGSAIFDVNAPYRLMRSATFEPVFRAIPADTFAPNVIVSGAVSVIGARAYRMLVLQQPRQTGEVSIKKGRLLKAAVRAFVQTLRARRAIRRLVAARAAL
jgi:glycosyltransferase involved in cell wall biosynthesis